MGTASTLRNQLITDATAVDNAIVALKNAIAARQTTLNSMKALSWGAPRSRPDPANTANYTIQSVSEPVFPELWRTEDSTALLSALAAAGFASILPGIQFPANVRTLAAQDASNCPIPPGHPG